MAAIGMLSIAILAMVLVVGGVSELNASDAAAAASVDVIRFRIGFFAPERSETIHKLQDSRRGFQYLVETVNREKQHIEWRDHPPTPFQFELVEISSEQELLDKIGSLHFLVEAGGLDSAASELEARAAGDHDTVLVRCCSIENPDRDNDDKRIFDVRPPSENYIEGLLRSLIMQPVRNLAVFYKWGDPFHVNACQGAISLFRDFFDLRAYAMSFSVNDWDDSKIDFTQLASDIRRNEREAIIACLPEEQGEQLARAVDQQKYPLKAFFLTDGPGNPEWVEKMGDLAVGFLSATQLADSHTFVTDDIFETPGKYIKGLRNRFGKNYTPSSTTAASSISGYLLARSLRKAFSTCNPVGGASPIDANELLKGNRSLECGNKIGEAGGNGLIADFLLELDITTIIGPVSFGKDGRNKGDPFTIQLDEQKKANIVLPVTQNALQYPAKNRYQPTCQQGEVTNKEDFYHPCKPCPVGFYSDTIDASKCLPCGIGYYGEEESMSECIKCPAHTTTTIKASTTVLDCHCVNGYFNHTSCDEEGCCDCPLEANCAGGLLLPVPKAGYWMDEDTVDVYKCDLPSSCLGHRCAQGRHGIMCSLCEENHFKLGDTCKKCFGKVEFATMLILLYLTWYVANMVVSDSVTSLGMLLSFFQLSNVIGGLALNWPSIITNTFGITNILSFDLDILWPSCVVAQWSFADNFYVQMLFPLMMGLMALFGYFLSMIAFSLIEGKNVDRRSRKLRWFQYIISVPLNKNELSHKWDSTIAATLSSIEVSYITIARHLFRVFKCMVIAGDRVLSASPDILCHSPEHNFLVFVSVVGILFYLVGFMAFVSIKLFKMHKHRAFALPENIRRYGFLYTQFEPGYVWMSILSLARRLAFVAVWVFMDSPAFQVTALAVLSTSSLMIHVYSAPYVDTYLDVLFSFLLVALMFETFGGLLFFSENLAEGDRQVMEWVVMAVILLVVFVFIIIFATELKSKYYVHVLRRMHVDAVLKASSDDSGRSQGLRSKTDASEVSADLITTFQPEILFHGLRGWDQGFLDFDNLTDKLQAFMSDGSETSYLSTKNVAKFWRNLVEKFPELIDFLAIADESTRGHFVEFAKGLYTDYFLKKRVDCLQIHKVLNWRDMAPIAQWLSMCPESDRKFFTVFVARLFHRGGDEGAFDEFTQGITESGASWFHQDFLQSTLSSSSMTPNDLTITSRELPPPSTWQPKKLTVKGVLGIMKSYREVSIHREIRSGTGPLFHSAAPALCSEENLGSLNLDMISEDAFHSAAPSNENLGSMNLNKISEDEESNPSDCGDLGQDGERKPLLENGGEKMDSFVESVEVMPDPRPSVDESVDSEKQHFVSISDLGGSRFEEDFEEEGGGRQTQTKIYKKSGWRS
ncbi:hypothetical protein BSKO_08010 [Bryopsis sp. KO-2023]|nr:hypothetical protein BSKO_08010 [Bryopsis sp. KO-2023]